MSVHKDRSSYRVKWKQGGRPRSKTFARERDAILYDAEIKRAKALGPHIMRELQRGSQTLDEFIRGPWADHAAGLSAKTRKGYAWVLDNHLGTLGDEPLAMIDGATLTRHQRHLLDAGIRPNTVREILARIGAILQVAADQSRIPYNPARSIRKVSRDPRKPIVTLPPAQLEALIDRATGRDRAIITLGGYVGLRPIEIRKVPWSRLHDDRLAIEQVDTKPSARPRTITIPTAGVQLLKRWRLEAGRPADTEPIIGLTARELNYWNVRLRKLARRDDLRINSLRDTHASMLHHAGYTVPRAAERMGHTTAVHWQHYARVIDGLEQRYDSLDELIAAARNRQVPPGFRNTASQQRNPSK